MKHKAQADDIGILSKARFARLIKVSEPRVQQYLQGGMPTRLDGKVDVTAALGWLARRLDGTRTQRWPDRGWHRALELLTDRPVERRL